MILCQKRKKTAHDTFHTLWGEKNLLEKFTEIIQQTDQLVLHLLILHTDVIRREQEINVMCKAKKTKKHLNYKTCNNKPVNHFTLHSFQEHFQKINIKYDKYPPLLQYTCHLQANVFVSLLQVSKVLLETDRRRSVPGHQNKLNSLAGAFLQTLLLRVLMFLDMFVRSFL